MGNALFSDVAGGLIVAAILFVGAAAVRRVFPDWANAVLYAIWVAVAGVVIYVSLLAIGQFQDKEPLVVAEPPTVEERVTKWLGETGYQTMPLAVPTNNNAAFHINFQYENDFTVNVTVEKKRPDFLILRIFQTFSGDQLDWWDSKTTEQKNLLQYELMLEIGLDPAAGFQIVERRMGGTRFGVVEVVRHIPINESLNRPWFFYGVEFASRYMTAVSFGFNQIYEKDTDGAR